MSWLLWCWALPLSLPGLLLWAQVRITQGPVFAKVQRMGVLPVFIVTGSSAHRMLRLPWFKPDALCIGWVILARDEAVCQELWVHELVHVRQALRWGLLFPLAYAAASLWAWMHGRDAYRDNCFEQEAFHAEASQPPRENVQKKW